MRPIALAGVLFIALAGCAAEPPTAAPSPAASASAPASSASPTPSATPSPTPTVGAKPELADLVISHAGIGPVPIGTDLASVDPETAIFVSDRVDCGDGDVFDRWRANYPDRPLNNELHAFESGPQPGGFVYTQVYSAGPHTAEGIEVGDSRADLLAAYPDLRVGTSGSGRDRYLLFGSPANLFFDVEQAGAAADTVTTIGISTADPTPAAPSFHPPGSCA